MARLVLEGPVSERSEDYVDSEDWSGGLVLT